MAQIGSKGRWCLRLRKWVLQRARSTVAVSGEVVLMAGSMAAGSEEENWWPGTNRTRKGQTGTMVGEYFS